MSSKYRYYGPLGNTYKQRNFKQWVLVFSDGDELTLSRKRYAVMAAKSVMQRGGSIRIYEETVMRTIFANDDIHFRDPIMKMPHRRLQFPWLVTRGNSAHARVYVWENKLY